MDTDSKSRVDVFLDEYKRLEKVAVEYLGLPNDGRSVSRLEKRAEFRSCRTELAYCREVRNFLQHYPKLNDSFAVEPSDEMIRLLRQTIEKVKNPPKAMDIAVHISSVIYKGMDDNVRSTMIQMQKHQYGHIPILRNNVVEGVFSENTILTYLIEEDIIRIDENTVFSDLQDYLPIEKHESESFRFVGRNTTLDELNQMFEAALKKQDRIGLVFVTQTGDPKERLLGIISAWDLAAV